MKTVRAVAKRLLVAVFVVTLLRCFYTVIVLAGYRMTAPNLIVLAEAPLAGCAVYRNQEFVGRLERNGSGALLMARLGKLNGLPATLAVVAPDGRLVHKATFGEWRDENRFVVTASEGMEPCNGR